MLVYTDNYSKLCEKELDEFMVSEHQCIHDQKRFAIFDWYANIMADIPTQVELKTRYEYYYDDFDDFMINQNKINEAKRLYPHIQTYFYFWFKNGDLYRWKYDPAEHLPIKPVWRNDRPDSESNEPHIPKSLLEYVIILPLPQKQCSLK